MTTETVAPTAVEPTTAEIRSWALDNQIPVGKRGSLSAEVKTAYADAHAR